MFLRGKGTACRLILVTGGARSGKSSFALKLAQNGPYRKLLFIATAVPCDRQMRLKIARHARSRDGRWATLEEPLALPERIDRRWLSRGSFILLECLPTFLTNLILSKAPQREIEKRIRSLLRTLRRPGVTAVLVSNEVGSGIVPDHPLGRKFQDLLGEVNQRVAATSDEVYLTISGIPIRLK